jgi:hypothetical protein
MITEEMESSCSTNFCLERNRPTLKSQVCQNPNVWAFIQSLNSGQDGDMRRVFVNNITGMEIDENSRRTQHSRDNWEPLLPYKLCPV